MSRFDFGSLDGLPNGLAGGVKLFEHDEFEQGLLRAAEHFAQR